MADDTTLTAQYRNLERPSMMIRNLQARLPERGKIKIGRKGEERKTRAGNMFQPPQKLDHFVVTTLERGADNNFLRDEQIHSLYGNEPTVLPVRLLYDDIEMNFQTRYACFLGRTLWCTGDGNIARRLSEAPTKTSIAEGPPRVVDCTCFRADPEYGADPNNPKHDKCKMNGNLAALIEGAGGIGGIWNFRTTSFNTITGLMSSLVFIKSVTGGPLANIPLQLRIHPKQASNPHDRSAVTIFVVTIEFAGSMMDLQDEGHRIALHRATTHLSIRHIEDEARRRLSLASPDVPLPGDNVTDVLNEFYPEQIPERPARPMREPAKREEMVHERAVDEDDGGDKEPMKHKALDAGPETDSTLYYITDNEGVVHECETERDAINRLVEVFGEAVARGKSAYDAAIENNEHFIDALRPDLLDEMKAYHKDAQEKLAERAVAVEAVAVVDDTPETKDAAPEPPEGPAETPAAEPMPQPQPATGSAVIVPFNGKVRVFFTDARAALMEMHARKATPVEYAEFETQNAAGIESVRTEFRSWYNALAMLIKQGKGDESK